MDRKKKQNWIGSLVRKLWIEKLDWQANISLKKQIWIQKIKGLDIGFGRKYWI